MNKPGLKHRMKNYALVDRVHGHRRSDAHRRRPARKCQYELHIQSFWFASAQFGGAQWPIREARSPPTHWAVSHANSVTYVPAGTYSLTSNINFAAGTSMFGDGDTTIFTSSGVCSLRVTDVSNVALSSFMMTGSVRVSVWADSSVTMSNFSFTNINGKSLAAASITGSGCSQAATPSSTGYLHILYHHQLRLLRLLPERGRFGNGTVQRTDRERAVSPTARRSIAAFPRGAMTGWSASISPRQRTSRTSHSRTARRIIRSRQVSTSRTPGDQRHIVRELHRQLQWTEAIYLQE